MSLSSASLSLSPSPLLPPPSPPSRSPVTRAPIYLIVGHHRLRSITHGSSIGGSSHCKWVSRFKLYPID
ncbi:hypothetical protein LOK49_LG09G02654 [Camellia lanceoleosa]|uniref:Uncharacterized protein n=1 Tax=Camellia lanceoleosa TaxID=1840588 RepID=A0ACC0GL64_9ERIC|nr:hypothetical protein LOK49_LG09G02654 [Camellia lanceoleosa]